MTITGHDCARPWLLIFNHNCCWKPFPPILHQHFCTREQCCLFWTGYISLYGALADSWELVDYWSCPVSSSHPSSPSPASCHWSPLHWIESLSLSVNTLSRVSASRMIDFEFALLEDTFLLLYIVLLLTKVTVLQFKVLSSVLLTYALNLSFLKKFWLESSCYICWIYQFGTFSHSGSGGHTLCTPFHMLDTSSVDGQSHSVSSCTALLHLWISVQSRMRGLF